MRPQKHLRWALPLAAVVLGIGIIAFGPQGSSPQADQSALLGELSSAHHPPGTHGEGCATDISHPLDIRVTALDLAAPGGVVNARIDVEARADFEDVRVQIASPTAVKALTATSIEFGRLRQGEAQSSSFAVELPNSTQRRTVAVTAEAWSDGVRITRTTILNLLPGGGEPSRTVTAPDGRRVREVEARRIG